MPHAVSRRAIDESRSGVYHCHIAPGRNQFLSGFDPWDGRNTDHRVGWVLARCSDLARSFAVDFLDLSVLDAQLHLILRNRPDVAAGWSADEVAWRWLRVDRRDMSQRPRPSAAALAELQSDSAKLEQTRSRLASIAWLMPSLTEAVGRAVNVETKGRGSFWGARFQRHELKTDAERLACSLQLHLMPIHAGPADDLDDLPGSSARLRRDDERSGDRDRPASGWLAPLGPAGDQFAGAELRVRASDDSFLPIDLADYLELFEAQRRRLRDERSEAGEERRTAEILQRAGISESVWRSAWTKTGRRFDRELRRLDGHRCAAFGRRLRVVDGPPKTRFAAPPVLLGVGVD